MLHQLARFTLAVALAAAAPVCLATAEFRVVVHADNPVESMTREDLAAPVAHEGGDPRAAIEVVALHGDTRLLLTSSCGPDGQGRRAVLENRSHEAVRAKIETSIWKDNWFSSSVVAQHMVGPRQEKALGCTRRSDNAEKRYAIVEVSIAASHGVVAGHHERPARDAVSVVRSGGCGQGRLGQNMAVINRHPHSAIAVSVQYVDKVDGKIQRRYSKRYVLAPGATRRLGCSADGKLTRTFEVTEAKYR